MVKSLVENNNLIKISNLILKFIDFKNKQQNLYVLFGLVLELPSSQI